MFLGHLFGEGLIGLRGEGVDHFGDTGLEEVSAVDVAHFVVVGDDVGLPVVEEFEAALGLGVDGGEPVAVEVEPVVVGAAIGPAFLVLAITAVGAGVLAAVAVGPGGEALEAVGIQAGVEDDDGVFEEVGGGLVAGGGEVVGEECGGVGGAGFVAVDAIAHPDDDGGIGYVGWFFGCGDASDVGLAEGFELGVIFGGGDGEVDEGAAAVGAGVFGEGDAIRFGVDLIEVADEFVVMEMPVGELGVEGLFGGGDGGVGVGAFGEVVVEGGDFDGGGGKGEEEEAGESAHGGVWIADCGLRILESGWGDNVRKRGVLARFVCGEGWGCDVGGGGAVGWMMKL